MKKVLLVTLQGNKNYGNRLQNFALQTAIENLGFQADSLVAQQSAMGRRLIWKKWTRRVRALLGQKDCFDLYLQAKRELRCRDFSRSRIRLLYVPGAEIRTRDWSDYAYAVVGSDQVWHNWEITEIPDELSYFYLEFMAPEKRVAYAPSFGFTAFPEKDIPAQKKGLMGMHALSCREAEGCEMIRALTGRTAIKVLDPVLLQDAEFWSTIEKSPRRPVKGPYQLRLFLGSPIEAYQSEMDLLCKQRGLRPISINDVRSPDYFDVSPEEFLWLIHHADMICTDSFHTSAFSILFERDLRVYPRVQKRFNNMFNRLGELLELLDLTKLIYGEGPIDDLSSCLSAEAAERLAREKEASLRYLSESLGVE